MDMVETRAENGNILWCSRDFFWYGEYENKAETFAFGWSSKKLFEKWQKILHCPAVFGHSSPAPVETDSAVRIQ